MFNTMEDYLDEDPIQPNQQFVCLSLFTPGKEDAQTTAESHDSRCGIKIRGCYATMEQAEARVKELKSIDKLHHIYIGEVGKWLPFDPTPEESGKEIYSDKELNELMKKYKENREKCIEVHEERAAMMASDAKKENKKNNKKRKKRNKTSHESNVTMLGVNDDVTLLGANDDTRTISTNLIESDEHDDNDDSGGVDDGVDDGVEILTSSTVNQSFDNINDVIDNKMKQLSTK